MDEKNKPEQKQVEKKPEVEKKAEEAVNKEKAEEKKVAKKKEEKVKIKKKDKAEVNGKNLAMSTKQAVAICKFIKRKSIEEAIEQLEEVVKKKRPIPMKGEYPHRKGKGMERGRFPVNASKLFIKLLRSLMANSTVNNMENVYIGEAKANIASRPHRRLGQMRFKRTHVYLEAKERKAKTKGKNEEIKKKVTKQGEEIKEKK